MLVLRDINSPEIRRRFAQGDIDLRIPVHQFMYAQNWPQGVYVQKLLQRLHTMQIIPDSLPSLNPKVEVRLRFQDSKVPSRIRMRGSGWRDTEPGELLPSKTLMQPPRIEIIPHYREWWESRKYTIVMLDLGSPLPSGLM
jgi:large subunit ribosomal protein L35